MSLAIYWLSCDSTFWTKHPQCLWMTLIVLDIHVFPLSTWFYLINVRSQVLLCCRCGLFRQELSFTWSQLLPVWLKALGGAFYALTCIKNHLRIFLSSEWYLVGVKWVLRFCIFTGYNEMLIKLAQRPYFR